MADEDCRAVEAVFAFIGRDFPRDAVVHGDCCLTLVDRTLPPATNAAVGCDPDTGRVNLLNLGFGKHTGLVSTAIYPDPISSRFPVDVVRLDQLEYLYLDGNNITYLIPENITLLSRLSVL
ncbi:hypothetical protein CAUPRSCDRAFT_11681 [Caulochytrium protostelioides]|nr:hypothetical protein CAUPRSCDRAFT_11681 [Caulochytrium protostelioides]